MSTENNKNQIFRQESLDRINSPEDLDRYIKTTNPSVWVILAAIIVFLLGVIIWSIFGRIESKASVGCLVENGKAYCAVSEKYPDVDEALHITLNDKDYAIKSVYGPFSNEDYQLDAYITHASKLADGEWFYIANSDVEAADGKYEAVIVFESIMPITFVISDKS